MRRARPHRLRFARPDHRELGISEKRVVRGDGPERRRGSLELLEHANGVGDARQSADVTALRDRIPSRRKPHELLGVGERQRPQQDRVHDAEDGSIGANGERQDQDRQRRKSRLPPHRPQRVAQVLRQSIQERQSARLAMRLFRERQSAQTNQRLPASLVGRHPVFHVVVDRVIEMGRELVAQLALE